MFCDRLARGFTLAGLLFVLGPLAAVAASPAPAAAQRLVAERITPENAKRAILGGPDAIGGLDDWALQNGTVCAVVSDPSHESDALTTGGALVDLGLCGREDDQFILFVELLNNDSNSIVPVDRLEASVGDGAARITTFGSLEGVNVETRYQLDEKKPRRLSIRTRITAGENAIDVSSFGSATLNSRGLTPFVVSTSGLDPSYGYAYPAYGDRGLGALVDAATAAELVVGVGSHEIEPGIAYGQRILRAYVEEPDGETRDVPRFFLSDAFVSVHLAFTESFWFGEDHELGLFDLVQSQLMNLSDGATLVIDQELWVGERADVASVTDLILPNVPVAQGAVDDPAAVIHVDRRDGSPFTEARPDPEGRFSFRLPPGSYVARIAAPGGRERRQEFDVTDQGADLGTLKVGEPTRVALPPGGPMRLVFVGAEETEDPDFADSLRGYAAIEDGEPTAILPPRRSIHLAGTALDPRIVEIEPGRYRVLSTRGPEFSVESATIDVRAGSTTTLEIDSPKRVLETPGRVASDFHIHSAPSLDNATPTSDQVANAIAGGSEVLISSEHDHVFDFAPTIERMGLGETLPSIVGLEVTSEVSSEVAPRSIGHANVFPMLVEPLAYRRGAVENEGRRWRDVIADLRALPGERVIQLNHARTHDGSMNKGAFFTHMGPADTAFDPETSLREAPNAVLVERDPKTSIRDLDFDAMEILNGSNMDRYERLREDWFALLRQGERIVATANSDSHFASRPIGTPRNYVAYEGEVVPPSKFDSQRFVRAVLDGKLYGTTGPIVDVSLDGAQLGETHSGKSGTLRVDVRSAPWVDVDEVLVYVNGRRTVAKRIASDGRLEFPLTFEEDSFVTVEVRGEPSNDYRLLLSKYIPFAFTNPIWIDADDDGTWASPG